LTCPSKRRNQLEGISEQIAEGNIWVKEEAKGGG
jgi:hypothetical protein